MLCICSRYAHSVRSAYFFKIQFSTSHKTINTSKLLVLGEDSTGKCYKAWHIAVRCSGVRICEFYRPDMLGTCSAYNDVDIERIFDLERQASQQYLQLSTRDQIREHTEAIYNGFIENWTQSQYTCSYSSTEYTCSSENRPRVFERNGVSICSAYPQRMLKLSRLHSWAAALIVILSPGTFANHFQSYRYELILST